MNLEKNKKTILFIITYTILLIFALFKINVILKILGYILNLFFPFILGFAIAFILNVLINFIENKVFKKLTQSNSITWKSFKRPTSIILSLLIILSFISLVICLIIPQLKDTVLIFIDNMPIYIENLDNTLSTLNIDQNIIENVTDNLNDLKFYAIDFIKGNTDTIFELSLGFASNVLSSIVNFFIALVFAIYLLAQKETLIRQLKKVMNVYLPNKLSKVITDICSLSNKTFANFISGQFLEAVIIGILCFIGMLIIRIPYAGPISVLVGFTALIPVFGAFIGTVIGAFLIFMVSPIKAIVFIIYIIVLQQFEGNLIYPFVVGKQVGLPGIWVLVAVTIGASINGVVGMLISVPLCSILYSLLVTNVNNRLKDKKI